MELHNILNTVEASPDKRQRTSDAPEKGGVEWQFERTSEFPPLHNDLIIRAARKEPTERAPVWIMRQAGRYLPEFKEVRAGNDFFQVCRTPELACELTLQPIRRYPLDAAIIFSDILVVPQCMGLQVEMKTGKGPVFPFPLLDPTEIDTRLVEANVARDLDYVFQAITLTRKKLEGKVPLIGFSGAPWTLMAYMVEGEGSKTFSKAKAWLYKYPAHSHRLLQKIADVVVEYLLGQVAAGAQLLQVFDSWAGELSPQIFHEFCLPYLAQIAERVKATSDVPMIVFAKGANHAIEELSKLKYDVLGIDYTVDIAQARVSAGGRVVLQGNLDPCALFATEEQIRGHVEMMLQRGGTQNYIANLGHGLMPEHNPDNVGFFIKAVQEISLRMNQDN